MKNSSLQEIISVMKNANSIIISGHVSPDADALGSAFALAFVLSKLGKKVKVLVEDYKSRYNILPGFEYAIDDFENEPVPDLFISVDTASIQRVIGQKLFLQTPNTLVIDHHISNIYFGKFNYIHASTSSTCEIVYEIISALDIINREIAICLFAGMASDTGSFRFDTTTNHTFMIASKLLEYDIDHARLIEEIMTKRDIIEFNAWVAVLNSAVILPHLKFIYAYVTTEKLEELGVLASNLEGIAQSLIGIRGIDMSVFAYEVKPGVTRLSFRSSDDMDANNFAKNFGGGGHKKAAGATIYKPAKIAIDDVIRILEENLKPLSGVINIYKEVGYTSHDVVAIVRKTIGKGIKVGHTGTLDPDAVGVLPICIGKATKMADTLSAKDKIYKAVLILGKRTDTQDITGKIIEEQEVNLTEEQVSQAILSFKGESMQMPPMYSAIKVGGKKLYELARKGIEIERAPRPITIFDIKILQFLDKDQVEIEVHCSKGTYIRTLCHDIGQLLGVGGTMGHLIRTSSGSFNIKDAITLREFKEIVEKDEIDKVLITASKNPEYFETLS